MSAEVHARYPDLEGAVVIVTGAAGLIGRAIVDEFCRQGSIVIATDIERLAMDVYENSKVFGVQGDITDGDHRSSLLDAALLRGGADILVNNAAIVNFGSDIKLHSSEEETSRVWNVNYHAPRQLAHTTAEQMQAAGKSGNITFITSVHAQLVRMQEHYHASKAALEATMREMAVQYGPVGIRVNAVAPGAIKHEAQHHDSHTLTTALGRSGTSSEVANAVAFLSSEVSSYTTGVTLSVDGGLKEFNWVTQKYLSNES